MTKRGDGPTTSRRGFGFREAQQAGIPWEAIAPRPVSEINAELEARHTEQKSVAEQVATLLKNHPHLTARAQELHHLRWPAADILWKLKQEASANRFERELRAKGKKH